LFICPSSPISFNLNLQGGKYLHDGSADAYNCNAYEGLLSHYSDGPYNANLAPGTGSPGAVNHRTFTRPSRVPFTWCSRRLSCTWWLPASGAATNNIQGAASWHGRDLLTPPRPTLFLDGHAKVLVSPRYTRHNRMSIMLDPYPNSGQLRNPAATPPHAPYDFWIDEY
jgi:hypothetical protein